ncbi:LisH dimerisation motif containing protein [Klebsormidium nitens]|uniref:LisH dimerisation motif containing protein n=1 Tax=Klebsormidium nitens TaxID=105231 RepID=A0A1Y1IB12_KLENI|nr:LisH dimerisation motif containing protein [Klebsormidium nitens]|eukprot:GAQ85907.1 LisH dimerisation motif containing protein [Klebsormidium nitens]
MDVANASPDGSMVDAPPSIIPAAKKPPNLSAALQVEQQLMRLPFEGFKKQVRVNNRVVEKEMNAVVAGVAEASSKSLSQDEAVRQLRGLVSRLQGLKRKLDEGNALEQSQAQRCRARIEHLSLNLGDKDSQRRWETARVDRILVDYMLRNSYYDTAVKYAEATRIQELVDVDVFRDAKRVIDALRRGDCSEALAWCAENRKALKKSKSKLEFQLRLQEFIELVRGEKMVEAIKYARKYLAPWGQSHMKELQQAMATLAFKKDTDCPSYRVLFDCGQWDRLIDEFKRENYKLNCMTPDSLLSIHLRAGLSALKTPFCYEEGCSKEDPLSQASFRALAEGLPFSKQTHSKLVCSITHDVMDADNPPLVLPNGCLYSRRAMEAMAEKHHGEITCPKTGFKCDFSDLSKAYIS